MRLSNSLPDNISIGRNLQVKVKTEAGSIFHFSIVTGQFEAINTVNNGNNNGNNSGNVEGNNGNGSSLPDLTVTALTTNSSLSSGCPSNPSCPRYDVNLQATIANIGSTAANNVHVRFAFSTDNVNFTTIPGNVPINTITAGNTGTAIKTWTNVQPGTYTIRVTADPNDIVSESDETNNVNTFSINVP